MAPSLSLKTVLLFIGVILASSGVYCMNGTDFGSGSGDVSTDLNVTVRATVPGPYIYGSTITLVCNASDNIITNIYWNTSSLLTDLPMDNMDTDSSSVLVLTNVTLQYSGVYNCTAVSYNGDIISTGINIEVIVPPPIVYLIVEGPDDTVNYDSPLILTCTIYSIMATNSITWRHNGTVIMDGITDSSTGSILNRSMVTLNDSGEYTCTASTDGGTNTSSVSVNVFVPTPMISDISGDETIVYSSTLTLSCTIYSIQEPRIIWTHNDTVLTDGIINNSTDRLYGSSLTVPSVTFTNNGLYTCIAINDGGMNNRSLNVNIIAPPLVVTLGPDMTTDYNSPLILTCTIYSILPTNSITWRHNGTVVMDGISSNGSILTRSMVTFNDSGEYTCTASNDGGTNTSTVTVNVFVPVPVFVSNITEASATVGTDTTLNCTADGFYLTYEWSPAYLNGLNESRVIDRDRPVLTIFNVTGQLDGIYTCTVTDFVGNSIEKIINFTAIGPILEEYTQHNATSRIVYAGDSTFLQCTFTNPPDAMENLTINWIQAGRVIQVYNRTNLRIENTFINDYTVISKLHFDPLIPADFLDSYEVELLDDYYEAFFCSAIIGNYYFDRTISPVIKLEIYFTPFFAPPFVNFTRTILGTLYESNCFVTGHPQPQIYNIKEGPNGNVTVRGPVGPSVYRIHNVQYSDAGIYYCVAENSVGNTSASTQLIVESFPDQVINVTVEIVSFFVVMVTWPRPSTNFGLNQQFTVRYYDNVGEQTLQPTNELFWRFNGFQLSTDYTLKVKSCNDLGCGLFSTNETFTTLTSDLVQLQQVQVPTVLTTDSSIFISWTLPPLATPTNERHAVVGVYVIEYTPLGSNAPMVHMVQDGVAINTTITEGIRPDTNYTLRVRVDYTEPEIKGTPVVIQIRTKRTGNIPAIPVDTKDNTNASNPSITVTWTPLSIDDGLEYLQHYTVRVIITDRSRGDTASNSRRRKREITTSTQLYNISSASGINTFDFTDITPFSTFVIDVLAALLIDGTTSYVPITAPRSVDSPETISSPPRNFSVVATNFTYFNVSWNPPEFPNGVISYYYLGWGRNRATIPSSLSSYNFMLPNLIGDTEYSISLTVENGAGVSSPLELTATTYAGVAPFNAPTLSANPDHRDRLNVHVGNFSRQYGPLSYYKLIVVTTDSTGPFPEETLYDYNNDAWRSVGYYGTAFFHAHNENTTLVVGNGITYNFNNQIHYYNAPLESGVNYRVFIRLFSSAGNPEQLYRDSSLSNSIEVTSPVNLVVILVPLFFVLFLIIIIVIVVIVICVLLNKKHPTNKAETYYLDEIKHDPSLKVLNNGGGGTMGGANAARLGSTASANKGTGTLDNSSGLYSPTITVNTAEVYTSAGQPTVLICESGGTPSPDVTWSKEGMVLEEPNYIKLNDGSLYISNTRLRDQGHFVVRATNSVGVVEEVVRVVVLAPSPPESDPNHPPTTVSDYIERMAVIHSSNSDVLEDEYHEVELEWNFTTYAAKLPFNHSKNRYVNIIPYDHSRVTLIQDSTPGSDYINASYIDGLNSPNAYIATQGPIPATFPDFWRMAWEVNAPTIVMVTNLKEDEKIKCHQYWPSYGSANYGNFQVTLKEVENIADYAIRTFQIQPLQGSSQIKEIRQYHFLVWPDHGVPQYATPLLSFQKRVRNYHKSRNGPMIVHCSAGVGRTGTFVTLDTMIMKIDSEGIIDNFNFVRSMRFCRNYMVQTASQYEFLHDAILEAIMCQDTMMPASQMAKKLTELKKVNTADGKTGLQAQFETLNSTSPSDEDFDCSVAQVTDNLAKCRVKERLPPNDNRVILSTANDQTDFICAAYVDGYRQRSAFMATQGPMKNTAGDLWRMIWEMKSMTVVMLTKTVENGEEQSVQYWPSSVDDTEIYGSFQVTTLPEERVLQEYSVKKFKLSPVNNDQEIRTITHFHYTNWNAITCPNEATSIIDLIADVVRVQRKSGNGPITVHCGDGLGRTGTFCAMFTVLERLKAEQVVDVFSTVKSLRIQRPGLIQTLDQYEFIHKAALEFVNAYDNYDNFKY